MKFISYILLMVCCFSFKPKTKQRQPNVIFILTDDQGYGDLSIHGNQNLKTPNIDQIAVEGAQFDRFYVSPLCAPSRASFLTGRYHLRTGVVSVSNGLEVMHTNETTLAEVFKENGYKTGIFGKWHNGEYAPNDPNSQGFDEFVGFSAGHWTNYFDTQLSHNGNMKPTKGYITDVLTDNALKFISSNKNHPFFCYIPFNAPHSPNQVPEKYYKKYQKMGLENELSAIYGMVENIDDNVAKITRLLKKLKIEDNTIVIFATDNGPNTWRYNAQMKGKKASVDEGGIRVPFFIKWNKKIAPKVIKNIAAHIDLMPTIINLAGLQTSNPLNIDGVNLAKTLLSKDEQSDERMIYSHVAMLDRKLKMFPASVRTNQYRWVKTDKENALYDMKADPEQKQNIITQQPELAKDFEQKFTTWFTDVTKDISLEQRPITIGKRPRVILQAHDAFFSGGIKFFEGHGWAHDWLTNWQHPDDEIWWDIDVKEAGTYGIAVQYTCPEKDLGSMLIVKIGDNSVKRKLNTLFDKPMINSPDVDSRKEAYEKEWGIFRLGNLGLKEGKNRISLKASQVKGSQVADIKGLIIRKIGDKF